MDKTRHNKTSDILHKFFNKKMVSNELFFVCLKCIRNVSTGTLTDCNTNLIRVIIKHKMETEKEIKPKKCLYVF